MQIHQIEISNLCNLRCSYCPHPTQQRAKGLMSMETFRDAIELALECKQERVYLHNFGEPLLHPEIERMVAYAVARGILPSLYTNAVAFDVEVACKLAATGLRELCVSEHSPGQALRAVRIIAKAGVSLTVAEHWGFDAPRHNWAGQIAGSARDSTVVHPEGPCNYQIFNAVVVLWDGRINTCCIDAEGRGVRGTIRDFLGRSGDYRFRSFPLCGQCSLLRNQRPFLV